MKQSRILIVEDENIVALDIKTRLTGLGYQVIGTVATGEEAVSQALETEPDLILMDINLRDEIDGVEAARQIQTKKNIPIIFLTAYADESTFQRAVTAEPFGYVLKPFDEKDLQMTIEVALYRHKMEEQLRAVAIENDCLRREVQTHADELEEKVVLRTTQLAREHGRLQLILDTVNEAICFVDTEATILYMNPAAERITGYTSGEALGRTPHIWRGTTSSAIINSVDQAIANDQAWQGEVINRRQDGDLYEAELQINPLCDADGNTEGYVITQRDISYLKELQRLKAQFVARIGHELRTPLSNIGLYLDLLERGSLENHGNYIDILRQESERLGKLIVGFLEISALGAAIDSPVLTPVHVDHMAVNAVKRNQQIIMQGELIVDYLFAPDLPSAMADTPLLEQALSHVVENAALYAPRNSRVIIKTAVLLKQDAEWITITVHNAGAAILTEEQRLIFNRFYRGEAAVRMNTAGAGLGLAYCKESLEEQGGFITVDSEPDAGVTFTIWLQKNETVTTLTMPS